MATPAFEEFGKAASDLFKRDFCPGRIDLALNTRANNGAEFAVNGTASHDESLGTLKTSGSLETRLACRDHSLSVTEAWETDNVLRSTITVEDRPISGLSSTIETTFLPATGQRNAEFNVSLAKRRSHTKLSGNLDFAFDALRGSSAFRLRNLLVGGSFIAEPRHRRIAKFTVGLAYEGTDFTFTGRLENPTHCTASLHHRLAPSLQWGVQCGWDFMSADTRMEIAMRNQLDEASFCKAKVDNGGLLSLAYGYKLLSGLQATLSGEFSFKSGAATDHRLGLALEFES